MGVPLAERVGVKALDEWVGLADSGYSYIVFAMAYRLIAIRVTPPIARRLLI